MLAKKLIGKEVIGSHGDKIGKLVDFDIDVLSAKVKYALINAGLNKKYKIKLDDEKLFVKGLTAILENEGFQVGFGYRNFTNANSNVVTSCSAILFTLINQIFSKGRSILFKKIMISGTGYFIDREIIDDIGGWIFTGMTEDVQLSTYCQYHNIAMAYDETIQYYDEEPTNMKDMHKQHVR